MNRLERQVSADATVNGYLPGRDMAKPFADMARQKSQRAGEATAKSGRTGGPSSTGEVILRSVRPGVEQGTVWELAAIGIENGLDVTCGKKEFPQAVTCIGNRALSCGASGATVNSAMTFAAETLVLAGYSGAASLMPMIGQGIIAYLLIKSIVPDLPMHADRDAEPASESSGNFVPATY